MKFTSEIFENLSPKNLSTAAYLTKILNVVLTKTDDPAIFDILEKEHFALAGHLDQGEFALHIEFLVRVRNSSSAPFDFTNRNANSCIA